MNYARCLPRCSRPGEPAEGAMTRCGLKEGNWGPAEPIDIDIPVEDGILIGVMAIGGFWSMRDWGRPGTSPGP